MAVDDSKFEFQVLQEDTLGAIGSKSKEVLELFSKWGLEGRMRFAKFTYSRHFRAYLKDAFVKDFFQSAVVNTALEVPSFSGQWAPLLMANDISGVEVEEVASTVLNMSFFDRLWSVGIVRESGSIVKCYDEMCGDFLISDELRKLLLLEDSDHYLEFSGEERTQFLFQVLKHLALGGPVNQYEDSIHPYLNTTKLLYKHLLTVVKDSTTSNLSIASTVLRVQAKAGDVTVFPIHSDHEQSFCYLIIDDIKRQVTVWYHMWY